MIAYSDEPLGGPDESQPAVDPQCSAGAQPAPSGPPAEPIDTGNHYVVGLRGQDNEKIVIVRLGIEMTREDALNLAAWLAVLADPSGERFEKLVKAIKAT